MNKNLIARYVWLVDTLGSHRRLTRRQISDLWERSSAGDGNPLPERTFHHYRRAVEEIFKIEIACNAHGEYFIKSDGEERANGMTDWLLDSFAINNLLAATPDIAGRIEIEEVPSAREFLPAIVGALRDGIAIRFDYAGFNRSMTERAIEYHPYFLKRYKQRWYMIGKRVKSGELRTYAHDRVKAVEPTGERFEVPEGLTPADLFGNILGVTSSKAGEREVTLLATRTQAKYFRALPLHRSQQEVLVGEKYSVFRYRLKLNYELVHELMSLGDSVRVLAPKELEIMVTNEFRKALDAYAAPLPPEILNS